MAPIGKHPDMRVWQEEPLNVEAAPHLLAGAALTPLDCFYLRSHGPLPRLDRDAHTVRVDGLAGSPLELSLADLRERFAERTVVATLACAGNRRAELMAVRDIEGQIPWGGGAIGAAAWSGASLADVLHAAGMQEDALHVEMLGADDTPDGAFGGSIPIAKALSGEVLLAWSMNGEPLPAEHGGPLRVVVPGYIGARSVKWISRIRAQRHESANPFQAEDYRLVPPDREPGRGVGFALGEQPLSSGILLPQDGAHLPAGSLAVEGWAVSGGRAIERVDVSADGGRTWSRADLLEDQGHWTWRRWRATVELPRGHSEITARAWDSSAATQPAEAAELWNPGGYVNTSRPRVRVRAH